MCIYCGVHMYLFSSGNYLGAALLECMVILFFSFFLLFLPAAYGSSQARGQIGAAAASLCQSQDPSCIWDLHCSSRQRRMFNPLIEARD